VQKLIEGMIVNLMSRGRIRLYYAKINPFECCTSGNMITQQTNNFITKILDKYINNNFHVETKLEIIFAVS